MRRIIGQFNQATLTDIEHLARAIDKPKMIDTSTLSRKQRLALVFIDEDKEKGIPWKLLRSVIKEVLVWGENDTATEIEVRFFPKKEEVEKFKSLWF